MNAVVEFLITKFWNSKFMHTSKYTPWSNIVEGIHGELKVVLRHAIHRIGVQWDEVLEEAAASHNFSPLSFSGYSPFYIIHLFHPRLPQDVAILASESGEYVDVHADSEALEHAPGIILDI